jgi:preprotein translocase subunit SecA
MVQKVLAKIFGTKHEREMKAIQPLINQINSLEPSMVALSDSELKNKTKEFKERLKNGSTLDDILAEAFAVCREASKRVLNMRHYDVQLIGAYILHKGSISEMRTGEGKTLVATPAIYLNALEGRGAHLVTVNDYLVRRDAEWMGKIYNFLDLTVGIIVPDMSEAERQAAYNSDITYCTNSELGFDYLRDNMKYSVEDMVQRELNYAIVDECDSILIDEARTPLIISGPSEASTDKYFEINKIIPKLKQEVHFKLEEKNKNVTLTEEGNSEVEKLLGIENLYDAHNIDLLHHVYQGLRAHHFYRRDVEYMIRDGEIVIVDEFTGRLMSGRRWSDGLHQAIEAKEGVNVKSENQTLATITYQNFFRMYRKISGMTGTADTEAVEFKKIYNLDVSVIPTNKPILRKDYEDVVYKNDIAKYNAIVKDVKARNENGQPILIGTASIEKSEVISNFLKKEGIRHDVLNAKHHEREAEIVAQAGRKKSITIATNMAGRGTDIVLGGNAEIMARRQTGQESGPEFDKVYSEFKAKFDAEKQEVLSAGGLYIIGTERHESRRIDNQLRGRSGRQGDPGASQFYLSLEDNLMRIFNGEMIQRVMTTLKVPDDEPITHRMVTNSIEGAQKKVEGHNFDIRKHLLDYDDVMNQQRTIIYGLRKRILKNENLNQIVLDILSEVTSGLLDKFLPEGSKTEIDYNGLSTALNQQFGISLNFSIANSVTDITNTVTKEVKAKYDSQSQSLKEFFDQVLKMVLLQTIDNRWKEHLLRIDRLKEGINLRGYAQKDPVIEYKKEAYAAFEALMSSIHTEAIEKILKIQIVQEQQAQLDDMVEKQNLDKLNYSSPETTSAASAFEVGDLDSSSTTEASTNQPTRVKMAPRPPDDGKPLNRAERRRQEKGR